MAEPIKGDLREALIRAFEDAQEKAMTDSAAPQPAKEVYGVDGEINAEVCADIALSVIKRWKCEEPE